VHDEPVARRACKDGLVREETALPYAPNPDEFRLNMQGMFTGIDSIDQRTAKSAFDETLPGEPDKDPWKDEAK
jgi:hypothetical protein